MNVKIVNISDIHLGKGNMTEDIIDHLNKFTIKHRKDIAIADLFIISGDVFDKLLSNNSKDSTIAFRWLTKLLKMCGKLSISLRILNGTPSHDFSQVGLLYEIVKNLNLDVDFKYVDTLSMEYIDSLKLKILYIPDEWKPTASEVYNDAINAIRDYGSSPDMIVAHFAYDYQLPYESANAYSAEDFSKLTKGPIITGHVHSRSVYENILVPGSFDRLTHASSDENEDKGGLLIDLNLSNQTFKFKFLINENAIVFKTYDVVNKSIDDVEKILKKHKDKDHVRFITGKETMLKVSILELKYKYPGIEIKVETEKDVDNKPLVRANLIKPEIIKLDRKSIEKYVLEHTDLVGKDITNIKEEFEIISNNI